MGRKSSSADQLVEFDAPTVASDPVGAGPVELFGDHLAGLECLADDFHGPSAVHLRAEFGELLDRGL